MLGHAIFVGDQPAAGQAVKNMNVMCGFPEETSLEALAVYP